MIIDSQEGNVILERIGKTKTQYMWIKPAVVGSRTKGVTQSQKKKIKPSTPGRML
jgi:hypothetical protein